MYSKNQTGFTLVELAISLMIIGLLLGGVLKGQELVGVARSTQLIRQLNSYDAAVKTFRVTYDALPGDMVDATTRIPNCSTPCVNGNGDKMIGTAMTTMQANYTMAVLSAGEYRNFWVHLATANMISGVDATYNGAVTNKPGVELPKTSMLNTWVGVDYYSAPGTWYDTVNFIPGNFYMIRGLSDSVGSLTPAEASFIDTKLDDGKGTTGDIKANITPATGGTIITMGCTADAAGNYATTVLKKTCNMSVRIR